MTDITDTQVAAVLVMAQHSKADIYPALLTLKLYGLATPQQEHLIEMMAKERQDNA